MAMLQLLAKPVTEKIQEETRQRSARFYQTYGRRPKLAVVLVGSNPASVIYTRKKGDDALSVGLEHESVVFPETASPREVKAAIDRLNLDPSVDGILIQRPLPPSFREEEVLFWVHPEKDVDAFHPIHTGALSLGLPCFQPCTPAGIMAMLHHYQINPAGKVACIIGRSSIVGKPMATMLLQEDATVIHCHSRTRDLEGMTRQADILVAAVGKPGMVRGRHVKEGAVVIDVGINRTAEGKVVGDVLFPEVSQKASAITPVPGGVGPMTITILLQNTISGAERRMK